MARFPVGSGPAGWLACGSISLVTVIYVVQHGDKERVPGVTGLPVQLDDRLRERLNWDGTQTFDAFQADWDHSTRDRDLVLGNGESSR